MKCSFRYLSPSFCILLVLFLFLYSPCASPRQRIIGWLFALNVSVPRQVAKRLLQTFPSAFIKRKVLSFGLNLSGLWVWHIGELNYLLCLSIVINHYSDLIMGAMVSQITSLTIVYSTILFKHRAKKTSRLRVTGLCAGNSPVTGEFPAQMFSNAENVSIWWRHHDIHIYGYLGL